ncbi:hypothetical protein AKJ59_00425 [candidate division MSBL1 archaeon SCGC-AAA385M02]|uniref:LamG-like jellyroll fold domain-containing protein n=1 Tax=candidate division MSBL1 archaeon SCGC-AAA385M02 TaxID=1698287 RepID=A0A133VQV7_9EURY|nr:hypothetical protein AKJ59_00425 [candidate division MSBL1 archaeon SCGC-AAA385M02]
MDYTDLNFDGFLHRTILSSNRQSPIEARNNIPFTSLSAASIGSPLSASTDITFSSTDNDTAAWTAGTIYFADGSNSGQIAAGNTGNIGATTYIYFDKNKPGSLQTATDHSEAVGPTKFLIAIVEAGAAGKDCKITPTIAAGLVVSGITADQIAANTVVVGNIDSTVTDRLFTDSTARSNVEAWRHATDATLIDGGDIYTESVTVGKLDSDTQNQVQLNLPSDEDLISCWNFNEGTGTNIYDSSGNDNTGTLGNTPTWVQGISGKCLDFNPANNEYAQLFTPSDAGTELGTEQSGKFSWSLWFRSETTSGDNNARIISRDCSDYWCLQLDQSVASGSQGFELYLNNGTNLSKSSINTNQWYHVVFVLNYDSGEAKLYVDGSLEDSNSNLGVSDGTSRGVCVAVNEENGPNVGVDEFDGKVDEIRVYNIALTAKEVYAFYKLPAGGHSLDISTTQKMTDWQHSSDVTMIDGGDIYTESVTVGKLDSDTQNQVQLNLPSDVNMVACWSFDSQNSSVAPDLSGKGNDGSLIGIAAANYGIGISQQRIDFNGTDEGMSVTDTSDINLMTVINRSYSFWIKADDTSTQQLVWKEGGGAQTV